MASGIDFYKEDIESEKETLDNCSVEQLATFDRVLDFLVSNEGTIIRKGTKEGLYALAESKGYAIREVSLGDEIIDTEGKEVSIEMDNPVRMGISKDTPKDKVLYVAVEDEVVPLSALQHDLIAVCLGGKSFDDNKYAHMPVEPFIDFVQEFNPGFSQGELSGLKLVTSYNYNLYFNDNILAEYLLLGRHADKAIPETLQKYLSSFVKQARGVFLSKALSIYKSPGKINSMYPHARLNV